MSFARIMRCGFSPWVRTTRGPGGRDGKRGHQHLAPPRDRMLENLDELVDRLLERPVIAVAVRRLEENHRDRLARQVNCMNMNAAETTPQPRSYSFRSGELVQRQARAQGDGGADLWNIKTGLHRQ